MLSGHVNYVPQPRGEGHIDLGADSVGDVIGLTLFLSAQYLVNQWLDSYQIFMGI